MVERRLEDLLVEHGRLLTEHSEEGAPEDFICPISGDVMCDPVVTSDGHTYDREAISEWLARCVCLAGSALGQGIAQWLFDTMPSGKGLGGGGVVWFAPDCGKSACAPPPPPRAVLEWPCTVGGMGWGDPPGHPRPLRTKVIIVGKHESYHWKNLVGPFLVHKFGGGPRPPPPLPPCSNISPTPPPPPRAD